MILRILWNYVITRVPRDETSDYEEEDEIQDEVDELDEIEDADANGAAIKGTNGEAKEGLKVLVNGKAVGEVTQEKGKIKAKKEAKKER